MRGLIDILFVHFVTTFNANFYRCLDLISYQFVIAQWSVWQLPTWEVLGSNPGKEDNLLISDKKGNLINLILNTIIVCVYELTGPV